ncbi:MAG: hypothetical protein IT373_02665 [Polyangiaceae bacterium]|nr:hypothetical protein [Polyangiaceae bacterium]
MGRSPKLVAWVALALGSLGPATARADDAAQAGELYEQAMQAVAAEDYARAAPLFAEADRLAPAPVALTSALNAALRADDAVLGMELVERAALRPAPPSGSDPTSDHAAAAAAARQRFEGRAGCVRAAPGNVLVPRSGSPSGEPVLWLAVGEQRVTVRRGARAVEVSVRVVPRVPADAPCTVVAAPAEPPTGPGMPPPAPAPSAPTAGAPAAPDADAPGGLHPAFFGVGAGVTVALAAGLVASGVDTLAKHRAFVDSGEGADAGRAAQLRTNGLLVGTLGAAVGTVVLGVFTRWSGGTAGSEARAVPVAPLLLATPAGGACGLAARF